MPTPEKPADTAAAALDDFLADASNAEAAYTPEDEEADFAAGFGQPKLSGVRQDAEEAPSGDFSDDDDYLSDPENPAPRTAGKSGSTDIPGNEASDEQDDGGQPDAGDDATPQVPDVEALRAENAQLKASLRRVEGRLGNMDARMRELAAVARETPAASGTGAGAASDAPTSRDIAAAIKSNEAFAALQREYPEWGDAMLGALKTTADELRAELRQGTATNNAGNSADVERRVLQKMSASRLQSRLADAEIEGGLATFAAEVIPAVDAWLPSITDDKQRARMERLWASDWGDDVANVVDAWKAAAQNPAQGSSAPRPGANAVNTARLNRGVSPSTGRSARQETALSEEEAAFAQGFKSVRR